MEKAALNWRTTLRMPRGCPMGLSSALRQIDPQATQTAKTTESGTRFPWNSTTAHLTCAWLCCMHCAKSYRPFELFVNENYKL